MIIFIKKTTKKRKPSVRGIACAFLFQMISGKYFLYYPGLLASNMDKKKTLHKVKAIFPDFYSNL